MNTGTLSPAEISGEVQLRGPAGGEAKTASTVDCLKYILGMFGYCGGNLEFSDNNKCELRTMSFSISNGVLTKKSIVRVGSDVRSGSHRCLSKAQEFRWRSLFLEEIQVYER